MTMPWIPFILSFAMSCAALSSVYWKDDSDLTRYVTRPEIKMPLFNITHNEPSRVTPGYWFVAPYANIHQERQRSKYYQACSTGPAIYDSNGELVWTGACQLRNQNVCDLRLTHDEAGREQLSLLIMGYEEGLDAVATIMDTSYRRKLELDFQVPADELRINMHELIVVDGGRSALYITHKTTKMDLRHLNLEDGRTAGWVTVPGFREVDLATGRTNFEWFSTGRISELESSTFPPHAKELDGPWPMGWSWMHPNSVDKDHDGNYLLSGRFTDTIYKIDSAGNIVWRLGGKNSSFHLLGFNFSKQHDARFVSTDGSVETISFFDNANAAHPGLDVPATSNVSSALIVRLDTDTMVATVIQRTTRPDNARTDLRGNYQILPNKHSFVSWAGNAYLSEHDANGELLLEAKWTSERFVTYRAYKANFTATPHETPVMKALVYGPTPNRSTTAWYASWNGATEVDEWRFYGGDSSRNGGLSFSLVGATPRLGFETQFASDGFHKAAYAEAIAKNGTILGRTDTQELEIPADWGQQYDRTMTVPSRTMPVDMVHAKDEL